MEVAYLQDRIPGGVDPTAPSCSSKGLKGSGISGAPLFSELFTGKVTQAFTSVDLHAGSMQSSHKQHLSMDFFSEFHWVLNA